MSNRTDFRLPEGVDSDKVFLINLSQIEGRLDPQYYFAKNNIQLVNNTKFPVFKIGQVLELQRGRFGHRPRNDPRFYNGDYPFIQTGDIVKASLNNQAIQFSQTLNEWGLKTSRLFIEKTVVFTIAANIGYTAILDYPACFPDSLIGIKPLNNDLLLEYINIYFRHIRWYIDSLAPQSAQKNINYQQLYSIPIIIPTLEVQKKLIDLYEKNHNEIRELNKKAEKLLASINDYLLAELGITLPKVDNALENRMFTVNLKNITGKRFDPFNHLTYYQELEQQLYSHQNGYIRLIDLITATNAGQWGDDYIENYDQAIYEKSLVIRSTEFDNKGNLSFDENKIKYRLLEKAKLKKMNVKLNDLLIEKSGGSENQPVGRIALLDKEIFSQNKNLAFSNFIQKITVDNSLINPTFLFYYLKMLHDFKYTERMQSQTNGIRNLILSEYYKIPIIKLSLNQQETIVNHINQRRTEAKTLQQEAKHLLDTTNQYIEHRILGATD